MRNSLILLGGADWKSAGVSLRRFESFSAHHFQNQGVTRNSWLPFSFGGKPQYGNSVPLLEWSFSFGVKASVGGWASFVLCVDGMSLIKKREQPSPEPPS